MNFEIKKAQGLLDSRQHWESECTSASSTPSQLGLQFQKVNVFSKTRPVLICFSKMFTPSDGKSDPFSCTVCCNICLLDNTNTLPCYIAAVISSAGTLFSVHSELSVTSICWMTWSRIVPLNWRDYMKNRGDIFSWNTLYCLLRAAVALHLFY